MSVSTAGGIPEFDTTHLFCPSDSPTLLPEEMQPEMTGETVSGFDVVWWPRCLHLCIVW